LTSAAWSLHFTAASHAERAQGALAVLDPEGRGRPE
jgi:hypothetical protein